MKTWLKVLLSSLLLLTLHALVQAQFTFTTNNGAITITGYTGSGGAVAIPSTTNGYPVTTTIRDYAFNWCTSLTSVTIPGSVIGFMRTRGILAVSVLATNPLALMALRAG
jgi:hypothetical protein